MIAAGRSLFVAAMTRTSTRTRCVLPTGSTTWSCSTRSTLACVFRLMSPISSRKIVPPSAASNFPRRSVTAPVNAPRVWPNSSDSISSSGIAAQLTSMNGPPWRLLRPWIDRATSSLPVPFSPNTSTRPLVGAAIATCSRNWTIASLSPTMVRRRSTRARRSRFSASRVRCRMALRTTRTVFSSESGFSTKSYAPILIARTADSMLPWPEITITWASTCRSRRRVSVASPSIPGSQMSSTMTSKLLRVTRSRQASPVSTASTSYSSSRSTPPSADLTPGSSSTMRMLEWAMCIGRTEVRPYGRRSRPATRNHQPAIRTPQHGSSIVNRVPRGALSVTSMLPPCSAMILRTIARPSPLPRRLVEKYGMNSFSRSAVVMPGPSSATMIRAR